LADVLHSTFTPDRTNNLLELLLELRMDTDWATKPFSFCSILLFIFVLDHRPFFFSRFFRKSINSEMTAQVILLGNSFKSSGKEYGTKEYLAYGALAYGIVYVALISYTNLKPAIPLLNNRLFDNFLFELDNTIFHLISLGGFLSFPKYAIITTLLDTIYFQMWTLACITLVVSYRDLASFWRVITSWCLAFGFSLPISILFPSVGPAFYKPELFTHIKNTYSAHVMSELWHHYLLFQKAPLTTSIVKANGIVAMPSLHIALVYLSVLVLGQHIPSIRRLLWLFLTVFVIATVYLGWHYLTDGLVGLLLGYVTYKISTLWFYEPIEKKTTTTCK
jgi:membrane-associated phospholipid phosphatase